MQPASFKGQNVVIAENQPEYLPLPAFFHQDEVGTSTSCWKLSILERIVLLFTGRLWVSTMTFGKPFLPQFMSVVKPTAIKE